MRTRALWRAGCEQSPRPECPVTWGATLQSWVNTTRHRNTTPMVSWVRSTGSQSPGWRRTVDLFLSKSGGITSHSYGAIFTLFFEVVLRAVRELGQDLPEQVSVAHDGR